MWLQCKESIEPIFANFKYIEIPSNLSSEVSASNVTPGGETPRGDEDDQIMGNQKFKRSNSMIFTRLLSEQEINKVKDRFYEDANIQMEEAMRKHANVSMGGTPLWLYIVLVYFAYDDIFRMLANPILFYPLVLFSSILGMLYSMGLGPIMLPAIK